jgi:hypothetical protein
MTTTTTAMTMPAIAPPLRLDPESGLLVEVELAVLVEVAAAPVVQENDEPLKTLRPLLLSSPSDDWRLPQEKLPVLRMLVCPLT